MRTIADLIIHNKILKHMYVALPLCRYIQTCSKFIAYLSKESTNLDFVISFFILILIYQFSIDTEKKLNTPVA